MDVSSEIRLFDLFLDRNHESRAANAASQHRVLGNIVNSSVVVVDVLNTIYRNNKFICETEVLEYKGFVCDFSKISSVQ